MYGVFVVSHGLPNDSVGIAWFASMSATRRTFA
jgi:hypothetical protein